MPTAFHATKTRTDEVIFGARNELDLDSLRVRPEIPELEDVSEIGWHTMQIKLGSGWTAERGDRLELGSLFDSVRLKVNGQSGVTSTETRWRPARRIW